MQSSSVNTKHPGFKRYIEFDKMVILKFGIAVFVLFFAIAFAFLNFKTETQIHFVRGGFNTFQREGRNISYDAEMPLIFIGGMPRSGTTLLRAVLDAHSMVRCGEETHIIPRMLGFREMWYTSNVEEQMLLNGGLTKDVMKHAFASFILEVIVRHGEPADRLCNKDPFTMRYAHYTSELFPNAKFLWIVRDGRATVHSIMSRQINIKGYKLDDYRDCLTKWNAATEDMLKQCRLVGPDRCLLVYYEQMVINPRFWLEHITGFLGLPWEESILQHEKFIGLPGGISVSPMEKSSDQIVKPIHTDALSSWVGKIPLEITKEIKNLAPMLRELGYNPDKLEADYSLPVRDSSSKVKSLENSGQEKLSQRESWILMSSFIVNRDISVPELK